MAIETGYVIVSGGIAGDYVVVLDRESLDAAHATGLPVYTPKEIHVLDDTRRVGGELAVLAAAVAKRDCLADTGQAWLLRHGPTQAQ